MATMLRELLPLTADIPAATVMVQDLICSSNNRNTIHNGVDTRKAMGMDMWTRRINILGMEARKVRGSTLRLRHGFILSLSVTMLATGRIRDSSNISSSNSMSNHGTLAESSGQKAIMHRRARQDCPKAAAELSVQVQSFRLARFLDAFPDKHPFSASSCWHFGIQYL